MIQQATNMILRVALRSPSLIIFSIISIMLFAPRLSLAFVVSAPILIIGFIVIMRIAYKHFMRMFKRLDNLNLTIQEDLIAIRTVKSFTREGYEVKRFNNATHSLRDVAIRAEQ